MIVTERFDIKSGDLIEWVDILNNELVVGDKFLWSSTEKRYAPICSKYVHMCISVDDETYSWLNEKGLFHAHVDDTRHCPGGAGPLSSCSAQT